MTQAIATYAAFVGTLSLIIAFVAYRQSGPRVVAYAVFRVTSSEVWVTVFNKGRGEITITDIRGWVRTGSDRFDLAAGSVEDQLPHRLEGHGDFKVTIPVSADGPDAGHVKLLATIKRRPQSNPKAFGGADIFLGDGRVIRAPLM